jgi:methyl-accepting chemotaxis protein-2 (aspartate sensor receptor)
MEQVSQNIDEKYNAYFAGLTELIQFLKAAIWTPFQPTQGMQNAPVRHWAFDASSELYHTAFAESQNITVLPNGRWPFWRALVIGWWVWSAFAK